MGKIQGRISKMWKKTRAERKRFRELVLKSKRNKDIITS